MNQFAVDDRVVRVVERRSNVLSIAPQFV